MNTIEIVSEAIRLKKPISYEYNKPGKTPGQRTGNPYVVYNFTAKSGQRSVKLHIVQTSGVSDSDDRQPLPSFRTHDVVQLSNVRVLHGEPDFIPNHPDYNPNWEGYDDVIAQVILA